MIGKKLQTDRLEQLVARNASLARFTAARLGGEADWLYHARNGEEEMIAVVQEAWQRGWSVRVLGKGANVLIAPRGVRGLVVINENHSVRCTELHDDLAVIQVSSGVSLGSLARFAQRRGIAGLEWLATVPGTIGGAVVNNAGAHGGDISSSLTKAEILIKGQGRCNIPAHEMEYAYRNSRWKAAPEKDFLILFAELTMPRGDPQQIEQRMQQLKTLRKQTQPAGASLGSIFKNPAGDHAGRIIEAAGLKGYRVGKVEVSHKHANFFINRGKEVSAADAADYDELIQRVQSKVWERCGIQLQLEIEHIGEW